MLNGWYNRNGKKTKRMRPRLKSGGRRGRGCA